MAGIEANLAEDDAILHLKPCMGAEDIGSRIADADFDLSGDAPARKHNPAGQRLSEARGTKSRRQGAPDALSEFIGGQSRG